MRISRMHVALGLFALLLSVTAFGCGDTSSRSTASNSSKPEDKDNSSEPAADEPEDTPDEPAESDTEADKPETDAPETPEPDDDAPSTTETTTPDEPKESGAGSSITEDASLGPWGHLKGRFVYDGAAPTFDSLAITKDKEFCGKHDVPNETLIVNSENGGLANVGVFLYLKRGAKQPPVHESYAESASSEVRLDNIACRFEPHVCLLRTSQTLVIGNKDEVGHNAKVDTVKNPATNAVTPVGQDFKQEFPMEESRPAAVSCSIHPWMTGWIIIRDNPYFAVSDKDGNFEIQYLPEGDWTLQIWHEKTRGIDDVKIDGKSTEWKRGRAELTVKAGQVIDWGDIHVASSVFEDE